MKSYNKKVRQSITLKNNSKNKFKLLDGTRKKVYKKEHYYSGDGMLTSVWGPSLWHFLHTMSFNYPTEPTKEQKKYYKNFFLNLQYTLPCKYCRMNLVTNLKQLPLTQDCMKNRETFSMYIYNLHELINKMLKKTSGLTYEDVRERYEHFRARCGKKKNKIFKLRKTKKKHKGCTEPIHKVKSKGVIHIVPQNIKCDSMVIDNKCTQME